MNWHHDDEAIGRRYRKVATWAMQWDKETLANALASLTLTHLALRGAYRAECELSEVSGETAEYGAKVAAYLGPTVARLNEGRKKGGEKGGRAKIDEAAHWQQQCVKRAQKLLKTGKSRRDLAGILAPEFQKSARQIRAVLKKAEVN